MSIEEYLLSLSTTSWSTWVSEIKRTKSKKEIHSDHEIKRVELKTARPMVGTWSMMGSSIERCSLKCLERSEDGRWQEGKRRERGRMRNTHWMSTPLYSILLQVYHPMRTQAFNAGCLTVIRTSAVKNQSPLETRTFAKQLESQNIELTVTVVILQLGLEASRVINSGESSWQ